MFSIQRGVVLSGVCRDKDAENHTRGKRRRCRRFHDGLLRKGELSTLLDLYFKFCIEFSIENQFFSLVQRTKNLLTYMVTQQLNLAKLITKERTQLLLMDVSHSRFMLVAFVASLPRAVTAALQADGDFGRPREGVRDWTSFSGRKF